MNDDGGFGVSRGDLIESAQLVPCGENRNAAPRMHHDGDTADRTVGDETSAIDWGTVTYATEPHRAEWFH